MATLFWVLIPMLEVAALRRFETLIRARCGIQMRAPEAVSLGQTLSARMLERRLDSPSQYLDWLDSCALEAREEWKKLFVLLTNQESYFFRDSEQLAVIRDRILPELLRRNQQTRTLRIWSAGCSTGEEPYSLAMMLEDALPAHEAWKVLILGTDISEAALERARRGVYGAWSFRALQDEVRARFFVPRGKEWEVRPSLRRQVTLAAGNLFNDEFPLASGDLHDMDLIVCRNVFIYFGRDEVAQVLRKFSATLRPDGFLVAGHAELHGAPLGDLEARSFPRSVVYQRTCAHLAQPQAALSRAAILPLTPAVARPALLLPKPSSPSSSQSFSQSSVPGVSPPMKSEPASKNSEIVAQATTLIRRGEHREALILLKAGLKRDSTDLALLCLMAQAQANLGHLEEAEASCQAAIALSAFATLPYQVLARIAAERGWDEVAKKWLKNVIYLNPASVRAYLELGALYSREADTARAAQMTRAALAILEGLSDDVPIRAEEYAVEESLTAGEIKRQLQADLADQGGQ